MWTNQVFAEFAETPPLCHQVDVSDPHKAADILLKIGTWYSIAAADPTGPTHKEQLKQHVDFSSSNLGCIF